MNIENSISNNKIILFATGILFFVLFFARVARASSGGECLILSPNDAARIAQENNPKVTSLRHRVEVEAALIEPSGSLPDPILGIGVANLPTDTFSFDQESMTQTQVRLTQKLPFPGKLSLRSSIQGLRKEIEAWRLKASILDVRKEAISLWWELYRIETVLHLVSREESTLKKIIELSSSRYETGSGLQSDVLLSQLELTRLLDRKIALQAKRKDVESKLLSTLGKRDGCIELKKEREMPSLVELSPASTLFEQALKTNPSIKEKETRLKLKRLSYELRKKDFYPDFSITGAYGKRFGDNPDGSDRADFATLVFSLNIPIFYKKKQSLRVVSSLEAIRSVEEALHDEELRLKSAISGRYATYSGLLDQERLYRHTIIPKAETTLSALNRAYGAGKADILGLLRAELMLYRFKESHINVLARAKRLAAELDALVGRDHELVGDLQQ